MPDRPPPVRLNAPPRSKSSKSKPPRRPRARQARATRHDSTLLYWIAGGLVVLLLVLIAVCYEIPEIRGWFATRQAVTPKSSRRRPRRTKPPGSSQPTDEAERRLKEKAAEETRLLEERTAPKPRSSPGSGCAAPRPAGPDRRHPWRTRPRVAARSQQARHRTHRRLPGRARAHPFLVRLHRRRPGDAHAADVARLSGQPWFAASPVSWISRRAMPSASRANRFSPTRSRRTTSPRSCPSRRRGCAKSKATRLGYNDIWEMLAEKFHCTRGYLKALNRDVTTPIAGTEVIGPESLSRRADSEGRLAPHSSFGNEPRGARREWRSHRLLPLLHREGQKQATARTPHRQGGRSQSRLHVRPGALRRRRQGRGHHAQNGASAGTAQSGRHDLDRPEPAGLRHPRHARSRRPSRARSRTAASASPTGTPRRC